MGAALVAAGEVTLAAVLAAGGALTELPQAARATLSKRTAGGCQRERLKDTGHASIREQVATGSAEGTLIGDGLSAGRLLPFHPVPRTNGAPAGLGSTPPP
jgi:hypothetical protein